MRRMLLAGMIAATSAAAAPPDPDGPPPAAAAWAGATRSQGNSPIQLCLRFAEDTAAAELWWAEFDRISIEAVLPVRDDCRSSRLADGRERLDGPCRSVRARVPDRHPVYDYTSTSELRCVLGERSGWCRLPYTDWFALQPAPGGCVAARAP